jgi:hypothetical protein
MVMKTTVQKVLVTVVLIIMSSSLMGSSYQPGVLQRSRPTAPPRLAPLGGDAPRVAQQEDDAPGAAPAIPAPSLDRYNRLPGLSAPVVPPVQQVDTAVAPDALPALAGAASHRHRGLVKAVSVAVASAVDRETASPAFLPEATVASPQKLQFSLTTVSQVLLKKKAEFLFLDLTNKNERAWLLHQIDKPDNGKKWFRKDNLPDMTQQAARGIVQPVFTLKQLHTLLNTYSKRARKECNNKAGWLDDGMCDGQPHDFIKRVYTKPFTKSTPYIEKVFVKPDETLICMGDLQGSLHSLLRNLWHMVERGQLKDDFTLAPNHRVIFLGNMANLGVYGVEVIALLLMLKLSNWDAVHFARGNHEGLDAEGKLLIRSQGFLDEFMLKYPDGKEVLNAYNTFFFTLPHALFVGVGDEDSRWWMQFSHGGVDPFVSVGKFLGKGSDAHAHKAKRFAWVASLEKNISSRPELWPMGAGFASSAVTGRSARSTFALRKNKWEYAEHGYGICASIQDINDYLTRNNLSCLFRGDRQQPDYSFKLLIDGYDQPQTWRLHPAFADYTPKRLMHEGFKPAELCPRDGAKSTPCFTCTTAGEGRFQFSDGYVIVHCANTYADMRVHVYENHLSLPIKCATLQETLFNPSSTTAFDLTAGRFGHFMTLAPRAGNYDDPFASDSDGTATTAMHRWVKVPTSKPIDSALIAIAKSPFSPKPISSLSASDTETTLTDCDASVSVESGDVDASSVSVHSQTPPEAEAPGQRRSFSAVGDADDEELFPGSKGPFATVIDDD